MYGEREERLTNQLVPFLFDFLLHVIWYFTLNHLHSDEKQTVSKYEH